MPPGFSGNLIFAIIARMLCGNHLNHLAWYRLDGIQGKINITTPRLDKALHHTDNTLQDPRLSASSLASIVGKIISMSPVLGNLSRTMTRH